MQSSQITFGQITISFLVLLWALRLSGYIAWRKIGQPEDFRYLQWRKEWGSAVVWRGYLQVFILQMLLLMIVALPLFFAFQGDGAVNLLVCAGLLIGFFGLVFECISDYQKYCFKTSAPKGSIIATGLWRYSRHPNYFGESVFWWGVALVAYGCENSYWVFISPLLITFLLRYISGVPMLEKRYAANEQFRQYASKTSVFIPWFPKK